MSVEKFKFISPGVEVDEIDNSQFPALADAIGPVVFGRSERGPGLRPVKVKSFSEFIQRFGNPIAGGIGGDVWREGNYTAPTYGAYAAQAWLKNNNPLTFVRLLGAQHTNAALAGYAGWQTTNPSPTEAKATNGGAYGLFVGQSGSFATTGSMALAAIFYLEEGSVKLQGTAYDAPAGAQVGAAATLINSNAADSGFTAVVANAAEDNALTASFNFNRASENYIRKVFNTNPTLTNSTITQDGTGEYGINQGTAPTNNLKTYWLGETFERYLADTVTGSSAAGSRVGMILAIDSATSAWNGGDYRMGTQPPQTGWIIGQDLSSATASFDAADMPKLLKIHGLEVGEWDQKHLKIAITDVDYNKNDVNPYGTFTIEIRKTNDTDTAPKVVERFTSCTLNPNSLDYVGVKVGDMYKVWDDNERIYRDYGNYLNQSKFIRVEVNPDVENGVLSPELLPFGFLGPAKFGDYTYTSASAALAGWVKGSGSVPYPGATGPIDGYTGEFAATFKWPEFSLRVSSSVGNLPVPRYAYWGIDTGRTGAPNRFDESYYDMVRIKPAGVDSWTAAAASQTSASFAFSLDDVAWSEGSSTEAYYTNASRASGRSISAGYAFNSSGVYTATTVSYKHVLDAEFNRFVIPLFGGIDGLDITEREPFRNSGMSSATETTNYAFNSIKRAIDSISDAEVTQANIATIPGVTNTSLTDHLAEICENRGDILAIVDIEGGFIPSTENKKGDSHPDNRGSTAAVVSAMRTRSPNSSYACAYHPWVQVKDTINGALLWVPPSVAALGVMASSEVKSQLWFAPAGFTRGGLSDGAAGLPVINVREQLRKPDRDRLYEVNINPIASFPSEGIVVYGQKTLLSTPSALTRVNVRRLIIYVKVELSRIAKRTLFDQNLKATWLRFLNEAKPFLEGIKSGLGLTDFRLVLDETTTTEDLVDRNIVYAKVALKPTKSIEFFGMDIALEGGSGASFDD